MSWDADGSQYVSCGCAHSIFISCHRGDFASRLRHSGASELQEIPPQRVELGDRWSRQRKMLAEKLREGGGGGGEKI